MRLKFLCCLLATITVLTISSNDMQSPVTSSKKVLIFGASGAIGKRLVAAVVEKHGAGSAVAVLRRTCLPRGLTHTSDGEELVVTETGVDLRDEASVSRVIKKHANPATGGIYAIWNLAAPLSVETEEDPEVAEDVTVGGFLRLIKAMDDADLPSSTRLLFSDSIGSFGAEAPREDCPASWLVSHPGQDPGSEYGRQKRRIRQALAASRYDSRWAVIPGVLHDDPTWGDGTTEYALAALKSYDERTAARSKQADDPAILKAAAGSQEDEPKRGAGVSGGGEDAATHYTCPVPPRARLPMIFISDLASGLLALMDAPAEALSEPEAGYALAGFSFSAEELFAHLQARPVARQQPGVPSAGSVWGVRYDASGPAGAFADLWPGSISGAAARRDLSGWRATDVPGLGAAVERVLEGHRMRRQDMEPGSLPGQKGREGAWPDPDRD